MELRCFHATEFKATPTSKRNLSCSGEGEVTMVMMESIHLCGFPTRMEATPLLLEKMAGEEEEEEEEEYSIPVAILPPLQS